MSANSNNVDLMKLIESNPERFLNEIDSRKLCGYDKLFTEYFTSLLNSKGLTLRQLIYRTAMSQSFIYQAASGVRNVGRDSAIILAFAMRLNIEQTQKFLMYSCNAQLCPEVRRDAIILCCLCRKLPYEETNDILVEMSEQGLV